MIEIKQVSSDLVLIDCIEHDDAPGDRDIIKRYLNYFVDDGVDVVTNQQNIKLFGLDDRVTSIAEYLIRRHRSCL